MAALVISIASHSVPSPHNQVAFDGTVLLKGSGPSGGYPWAAYVAADASFEAMRAACIAAAEAVATANSVSYDSTVTVGWTDVAISLASEVSARAAGDAAEASARATAIAAEATARDAAIAAAAGDYCAVPGASSSPSLAVDTARQPSSTRPVLLSITGTWSWSLSVIGTVAGTMTLQSDASSTPTTARPAAQFSRTVGVGVTVADSGTLPFSIAYIVPAGHYYKYVVTGGGTFGNVRIDEQVL